LIKGLIEMKKLALIHTVDWFHMSVVDPFAKPWLKNIPGVEIINICDDSLLKDSLAAGKATPDVLGRIVHYAECAVNAGADVIMVTCTTVNEAARIARDIVNVPVFNIDEPMAKQAVELGDKIGIVATLRTSAPATKRLLKEAAREKGQTVSIETAINGDAFDALMKGDRRTHDELVCREIDKMARKVDVIALGQISLSQLKYECVKPILQVGYSGFEEARRLLFCE
jgi:Asp/Glu/hydantoin racemase